MTITRRNIWQNLGISLLVALLGVAAFFAGQTEANPENTQIRTSIIGIRA